MAPKLLYERFATHFPQYMYSENQYYPNGKNSIRIKVAGGQEFIFTFHNESDWRFETGKMNTKGMGR